MAQIMLRISDDDATKLRMVSSSFNISMNLYLATLVKKAIQDWESQYGVLPLPPEAKRLPNNSGLFQDEPPQT